jgi:hypothetical protein
MEGPNLKLVEDKEQNDKFNEGCNYIYRYLGDKGFTITEGISLMAQMCMQTIWEMSANPETDLQRIGNWFVAEVKDKNYKNEKEKP